MNATSILATQSKRFHPKFKFSADEDARLKELVKIYGENNWTQIAQNMSNRNSRQCKERWFNYLSPTICNNPWTQAEDNLLIEKFHEIGTRWVQIAKFFPNRTDINVKNRYLVLARKLKKKIQGNNNSELPAKNSNFLINIHPPQVILDSKCPQNPNQWAFSNPSTPQPPYNYESKLIQYSAISDSNLTNIHVESAKTKPAPIKFPPIENLAETHFPPFSLLSPMNSIKLINSQSVLS